MPRPGPGTKDPYQLAVGLIGFRAHSEAELRQKLLRRGCEAADVEASLGRLRKQGYVDDAAYARAVVSRRSAGRGAALIGAELASKGISRDVATMALGELDHRQQVEAASRLVERSSSLDRRRLAARLQRRGFAAEVIREVVAGLA